MTPDEMQALQPGDLVRHKGRGDALIVHANYGHSVVAVRLTSISNPGEWDRVDWGGRVVSSVDDEAQTINDAVKAAVRDGVLAGARQLAGNLAQAAGIQTSQGHGTDCRGVGHAGCGQCDACRPRPASRAAGNATNRVADPA